jgi:hypothetical protein
MHNKTTVHKQRDCSGEETCIHSSLVRQMHCVQVLTTSRGSTPISLIEVFLPISFGISVSLVINGQRINLEIGAGESCCEIKALLGST